MRTRRAALACAAAAALWARAAEAQPQPANEPPTPPPKFGVPDRHYTYEAPYLYPTFGWIVLQLLPSPELAVGDDANHHAELMAGLRWQLTPVLWSWGVNRHISGWRFFVVDPLARMSGSIALEQHIEYIGGHVDRLLMRPGVKATFPLAQHGEYLAFSMGTSVYAYDDRVRLAYDGGLYTLFGTLGAVATFAPDHRALSWIATVRIRYF